MIAANRNLLARRFPTVLAWIERGPVAERVHVPRTPVPTLSVGGLQLASGYDPRAEAELQARLVAQTAERASVYGMGTGWLPRVLLARAPLLHLDVVLFHPGLARAVFERFDASTWLSDARVSLRRAAELAELERPFAAAPADLRLAEDAALRISDLVFLELATPHLARGVSERSGDLAARLAENRSLVERSGDAAELFGRHAGCVAWVAGAGPTLGEQLARLAARPATEPLIAVDAALQPLLAAGVVPDAVVTLDAHREHQLRLFAGDLDACRRTPLAFAPFVHADVIARWPGPKLAFYEASPRYAELAAKLPRATLFASGSVIHPAVDLAVRMGAAEVRFAGMDFANVGGRSHAAGAAYAREQAGGGNRAGAWVLDGAGERVPSLPNLVGYLRDLERYLAREPNVRFVNLSRAGARIEGATYPEEPLRWIACP
jgi:hypothetical protein